MTFPGSYTFVSVEGNHRSVPKKLFVNPGRCVKVQKATGIFQDVPPDHWAADWIEQLAADAIISGCSTNSKRYCPTTAVTPDQMAVFLMRAKHGSNYLLPDVGGSTGFSDVDPMHWAAAWIKQLVAEDITSGCGTGTYCPRAAVTRAQMAVFLVRTFNLS